MMRIAYICADPGVPVFGRKGCSVHVQEMLRGFLKNGAAVELFAARSGGDRPADLRSVRLHDVPGFHHPANADDRETIHRANSSLFDQLETQESFDLVYERYSLWCRAGMQFARSAGVPGVLEVNAPLIEEQARYRQLNAPELAETIAAQAFGSAKAICAVSSNVAKYLQSFPEARGRIHIIRNGVDPARFACFHEAARPEGQNRQRECIESSAEHFTIGFVGSLKPWHGLSSLASAFARHFQSHRNSRLLIVGDGPERENLLTQIAALGRGVLEATHLTGAVPAESVPFYLSQMDVAVAPYPALSDFYFSPLKVFEYMAAGLPVISSRLGDLPEIIRDGLNGILFAPGDVVELAERLDDLRRNPALCRRLGEAARTTVLERYTWDANVEKVLSLAGLAETSISESSPRKGHDVSSPIHA